MEKNDFILQVVLVQDIADNDMLQQYEESGATISITAWDNGMDFMIDQHITAFHPELMNFDIDEECEGDMVYYGNLNKDELIDLLIGLGYRVYDVANQEFVNNNYERHQEVPRPQNRPINRERLQMELQQAIKREDYERAAEIRDILNE
jgi:hypothetical protein